MIQRKLQNIVLDSLKQFPVVGILGARQVGKTTLARKIFKNYTGACYLDLELPSDFAKLTDPELYLNQYQNSLVIIDEVQKFPELFAILRTLVDQNRVPGRFLILGSASPALLKQSSESLAGRIIYHELPSFQTEEIGNQTDSIQRLWFRGGLPDSFLADSDSNSLIWRSAYIRTFLERDIPQLGIRIPALQLRKFWQMIAHTHGQLWNGSQIASSLGISQPTAVHYLNILESAFVVRQIQPYHLNLKKRLIKSPKIYFRDTGLLHALLNLSTSDELYGHPILCHSWEGFVIEQIINLLPAHWEKYFYRTNTGVEIDLVIVKSSGERIAIEVKFTSTPQLSRGFHTGFADLECKRGFVVYPGKETYPVSEQVIALPVEEIGKIVEER
ncbi:MAG: ATP-binding protein [Candidatus Neomarinimicrobiota bacterium]